jgi:cytoskeleton protein RodZ
MVSLGSYLRELRQRRGLSLEELSRVTRVAPRYLEALEGDDLGALPGQVFARGFLRAYCQALQTPADEAIALYHRQTGTPPPSPATPGRRLEPGARSRGTVLVSFVLLVIFGVALFAVANVLQSARERAGARSEPPASSEPAPVAAPTDTAPAVTAVPPSVMVAPPPVTAVPPPVMVAPPSVTAAPATEAKPAAPEPPPPSVAVTPRPVSPPPKPGEIAASIGTVSSPYRLVARVWEATWVRVRTEDGRAIEETIQAGETREWTSNTPFILTVGNAGGIALELNGRPLPPLGARGAVISRLVIPPAQQ